MANRKIKVLHCIRQGLIGGGESHVLDLIEHLDSSVYESIAQGYQVFPPRLPDVSPWLPEQHAGLVNFIVMGVK